MSNNNNASNDNVMSGVRAVNALLSGFNRDNIDSDNDSRDNSISHSERFVGDAYTFETIKQHHTTTTTTYPDDHHDYRILNTIQNPNTTYISTGGSNRVSTYVDPIITSGNRSGNIEATSRVSEMILNAKTPIPVNDTALTTVRINGQEITGIWVNREECMNWRGVLPLERYQVNTDSAHVIRKQTSHVYDQIQNISVRYLKPPALPAPGDLIIRHEPDVQLPPAPPIIVRQQAAVVKAPPTLIYREKPPRIPQQVPVQTITIPGATIPPPPRQVIVERMAAAAPLPQDIVIERWLGFPRQKRNVIHQKAVSTLSAPPPPKNVIIDWEAQDHVEMRQQYHFLGVETADPVEYARVHSRELVETNRLPPFVNELNTKIPNGEQLAANVSQIDFILTGDVEALKLVDKNKNLNDYFVQRF